MKDLDGEPEPVVPTGEWTAGADVPASLLAKWRAAEERLYPMVMVIPESYKRVVRLVGEATVELQLACPDIASLVAAAPGVADQVRRLAEANGFADTLDFALIAASACLMRYRQLEAEQRRDQRRQRIAAAADAGAKWVTLAAGAPPTTWPPLPSMTLEMHVATGRALEQTTTIDEATGAARFTLAEVQLDRATGEIRPSEADEQAFHDLQEWHSAIAERRQIIEQSH